MDREEHNFGKADVGVTGRHPFVFTNTGNEPLVLSQGRSTCGCCTCVCTAQLPQGAISPGRSAKVTLEWKLRITVKSGLPVGPFQQQIVLKTNSKSVPTVQIPVLGSVVGEISIAGRGWNARTGVLTMGSVSGSRGAKWPLVVVVRGPHAKDVRFKPVRTVPDFLEAELGSPRYISDKAISLTRLTIRIPPGSGPSTHRGAEQGQPGRITLRTNHPQVPDVNIQVRFTIGE